jgi:hypothetical protein
VAGPNYATRDLVAAAAPARSIPSGIDAAR